MFHTYEVHEFFGSKTKLGTHFSLPLTLFVLFGITTGCWIHDGRLGVQRQEEVERLRATIEQKDKDRAELLSKYQETKCRHRKLVVTTVENTKLCMDPQTKALFKIERDPIVWSGHIPLNLDGVKNLWPGEDD